ncbi:hypothetical protein GGR57DRAFT_250664 [Xylariaceae sp. FL1272]|nr:hypothetical protein GGR57DRAFT_250664 [Xylariaceae sp. FL1272]
MSGILRKHISPNCIILRKAVALLPSDTHKPHPTMSRELLQGATEWVKANPRTTAAVTTGAVLAAAPMAVAAPVLGALGFGAAGPAAGGIAAGIQAGVGNVVAPSLFATLQSAAMGGYGAAVVGGAVQAAGGVVAGGAGLKKIVKAKL